MYLKIYEEQENRSNYSIKEVPEGGDVRVIDINDEIIDMVLDYHEKSKDFEYEKDYSKEVNLHNKLFEYYSLIANRTISNIDTKVWENSELDKMIKNEECFKEWLGKIILINSKSGETELILLTNVLTELYKNGKLIKKLCIEY